MYEYEVEYYSFNDMRGSHNKNLTELLNKRSKENWVHYDSVKTEYGVRLFFRKKMP